jgi:hypothetical protein
MSWCGNRAWGRIVVLGAVLSVTTGCGEESADRPEHKTQAPSKPESDTAAEGKKVQVGQNVFLEILPSSRRVLISAEVCLREGPLELLLTRKGQKEHEAILSANIDARIVHEALLLAKAEPGSPARFDPSFCPATGTPVKIRLVYEQDGKKVSVPAQSWVRSDKTRKELDSDWVFAGSMLVENPLDPNGRKRYLANDGDVICVANFGDALLDVPVESTKDWNAGRLYVAWTDRIPEIGTKVVVYLEPVLAPKKK